jgi:hypothetical protein
LKIFLDFGAPHVLQSDNGREFTAEIFRELSTLWPELVLVHGWPHHPQSQGSVERSNATLKDSLVAWMLDKNTSNLSTGLMFVQWSMNTTYHEAIKMEPYKALFGVKPKTGLRTLLPSDFLNKIQIGIDEDELIKLINQEEDKQRCDSDEGAEERRKEDSELLNNLVPGISYIEDNIEMSKEIETIDVNSLVGEYTVTTDGVPNKSCLFHELGNFTIGV